MKRLLVMISLFCSPLSAGVNEFDFIGGMIESSFYLGDPCDEKFISDWYNIANPNFIKRVYAVYDFPEDDTQIEDQENTAKALQMILEQQCFNCPKKIEKFHTVMDKLDPTIRRKVTPLLFNYMYKECHFK